MFQSLKLAFGWWVSLILTDVRGFTHFHSRTISFENKLVDRLLGWPPVILPPGFHPIACPPWEWTGHNDLLLMTRIREKWWISLPWLGYKSCGFCLISRLCCLLGLLALVKSAAMLQRPMWQRTKGSSGPKQPGSEACSPAASENQNAANNHVGLEVVPSSVEPQMRPQPWLTPPWKPWEASF